MTLSIKMMLSAVIALLSVLVITSAMMTSAINRQEQTIRTLAAKPVAPAGVSAQAAEQVAFMAELKKIETLLSAANTLNARELALADAQVAQQKMIQDGVRRALQ